jgi:hypothetical protein
VRPTHHDPNPVRPARRHADPGRLVSWSFVEKVPWGIAAASAVVLLPSWLHPKTPRLYGGGSMAIQGWGWQNVASWMAALVLVVLTAGLPSRPRVPVAVACALVAAGLFAVAAGEATRTWIDLTQEIANPALSGRGADYELVPATGMDRTVVVAIVGAAGSLVLAGTWLRPGEPD